jgi:predicted phage terminase large subunit-like protein
MTAGRLSVWEMAAARLESTAFTARDATTPGQLAQILDPRTVQTPALELIDSKLVQVASGEIKRLIISVSPQEGKSVRCSHYFPTWMLMQNPDLRLGEASYEMGIARRWGRAVRNTINSHAELGLRVRNDTSAAHEWQLDGHDGGLYSVGLGGALTGRPLEGLIIDDPVKDRAQAESLAYRDAAWNWWTDVARTRFAPEAWCVLIMTRWHEDDLAGRLIEQDLEDWQVVNIPALADHRPERGEVDPLGREPGQWMESARGRTMEQWCKIREAVGERTFAALYQGRPAPAEGVLLKRQLWQRFDAPKAIRQPDGSMLALGADEVIQSWDMAFKDTKASDYVVGQVWGRWGNDAYLLDQVHDRLSFTATVDAVRRVSREWPQTRLKLVEDKANGTAVIDHLRREITGLVPVPVKDGKYARAVAVSPFIESRHVFLPADQLASWAQGLVDEAAAFPNSQHDDQVDAMTQALDRLLGHPVKVSIRRPPQATLPSGIGAAMGGQALGSRGYGR